MRIINIYNPSRLVFGIGALNQFVTDVLNTGTKRLYILSVDPVLDQIKRHVQQIKERGIAIQINTSIKSEPGFVNFDSIIKEARNFKPDCIAGIGGGSIMDMAKLIAVFNTFNAPVKNYIGIDKLSGRETRLICIPTTSGTGSEVSPNSILLDENDGEKKGIISPCLVPDAAYIDPELTFSLPPDVTAYTGLDALTHCIEAYVNKYSHPVVDIYALEGISLISKNLLPAFEDGNNSEARTNLALGSLYGGMCLGPVNTGAVHALAYPLGSFYKIPHGLSNAILLPYILNFNLSVATERFANIAKAIGIENNQADNIIAEKGIKFLESIIKKCNIPLHLKNVGIEENKLVDMADSAMKVQRLLKNNIREVSKHDAIEIYKKAF